MNSKLKSFASLLMFFVILISSVSAAFAKASPFDENAYTTIVTASDFQDAGTKAYDRFEKVLGVMKNDGLQTPDAMLMGGDFTKILFDYANPGITLIKNSMTKLYPEMNRDSVICIQGNHDNPASGFTKTGFYDMGTYCLYAINEDSFPWKQSSRSSKKVVKLSENMENAFNSMIESGDTRPVIIITHVPLHHTRRSGGGDNKYSSYIFNVINKAAEKLDIIFLFGHNHSNTYDDYIGGSVNFMKKGDTIRIPDPANTSSDYYLEETLNFTYTNCGYIGYSDNSVSETSTNTLTVGSIQLCRDTIKFTKYSADGLYASYEVQRVNPLTGDSGKAENSSEISNRFFWKLAESFFKSFFKVYYKIAGIFA